ncbi:hypothetical protein RvY_00604 [Ramazzottius varieornatus]|uniref:Uncharacterized protein n=1 Tax=Ramazzottius varieornatus TaxID=947166 RepID=A0A1D1UDT8_RAMVA|nr:hypothetical protein RvY_00604 [Ramazzottius varieornatus]
MKTLRASTNLCLHSPVLHSNFCLFSYRVISSSYKDIGAPARQRTAVNSASAVSLPELGGLQSTGLLYYAGGSEIYRREGSPNIEITFSAERKHPKRRRNFSEGRRRI